MFECTKDDQRRIMSELTESKTKESRAGALLDMLLQAILKI